MTDPAPGIGSGRVAASMTRAFFQLAICVAACPTAPRSANDENDFAGLNLCRANERGPGGGYTRRRLPPPVSTAELYHLV